MNQIILVGKAIKIETKQLNGTDTPFLFISTERNFKEPDGNLLSDICEVIVWKGAAEMAIGQKYLGKNLAITGRLDFHGERPVIIAENIEYLK